MFDREARAEHRRRTWSAELVAAPGDKPPLYEHLSPQERLVAFAQLQRRVWGLTVARLRRRGPLGADEAEVFVCPTTPRAAVADAG
jgi:hypothetical protein